MNRTQSFDTFDSSTSSSQYPAQKAAPERPEPDNISRWCIQGMYTNDPILRAMVPGEILFLTDGRARDDLQKEIRWSSQRSPVGGKREPQRSFVAVRASVRSG